MAEEILERNKALGWKVEGRMLGFYQSMCATMQHCFEAMPLPLLLSLLLAQAQGPMHKRSFLSLNSNSATIFSLHGLNLTTANQSCKYLLLAGTH